MGEFESFFNRAKSVVNSRKKWPLFETRLKRKIAVDVFKSIQGADENYVFIEHGPKTRNKCMLRLPRIKLEAGRKTTFYQGASIFNSLSAKIRQEKSIVLFKNLVNEFEFKDLN